MNILAVSDKVLPNLYRPDVKQQYANIDLLVGCGDLPYYYLDFLVTAFEKPMIFVRGNHDAGRQYTADRGEITSVRGGYDLHGDTLQEKGVIFAGLEGSMRYQPQKRLQYTENEMTRQAMRLIPKLMLNRIRYGRAVDVFIAHSPPFGIHDEDDLTHTGFKIFLRLLDVFKPRYMLHGHIHRYRQDKPQITQYQQTTIINVYPMYKFNLEIDQ